MTADQDKARQEIRARIDAWVAATQKRDLAAIMTFYVPQVRAFDAIGPLAFADAETYRAHWEQCLAHMQGDMTFTITDPVIETEGDLAVCHYVATCGGTGPDGIERVGGLRATICLRRLSGTWMIVHEHFSTPFDPQTGKALCDLKPDEAQAAA